MLPRKAKVKGKVFAIPIELIDPSPFQARRHFEEKEIAQLAVSILENGLLQPVSVRRCGDRYQLVAGERRLRACKLAKMKEIPAILCEYQDNATAALGLLENLQRQDLDPFEQARGIQDVIALWGCTQEEAAKRLGMAQPTLNNKLRLLQLNEQQQEFCREQGLTERHARAVLRLEEEQRMAALEVFARQGMNARQADEYVQRLLQHTPKKKSIAMVRDVRIFVNTINKAVRLMVDAGVNASTRRVEGDGFVEYTVRIPTSEPGQAARRIG